MAADYIHEYFIPQAAESVEKFGLKHVSAGFLAINELELKPPPLRRPVCSLELTSSWFVSTGVLENPGSCSE